MPYGALRTENLLMEDIACIVLWRRQNKSKCHIVTVDKSVDDRGDKNKDLNSNESDH